MASFLSLIGPALVPGVTCPAGSFIVQSSSDNTQATLQRSYSVKQESDEASLVIQTGLPTQSGVGSFAISLVPDGLTPGWGAATYTRQITAFYEPSTGTLTLDANAPGGAAQYIVSIDLAHTATR